MEKILTFKDLIFDYSAPVAKVYNVQERKNSTIKDARARVLYAEKNRNKTYFSYDFIQKLVDTSAYIPIAGEYDAEKGDFKGHSDLSKGYGCIKETSNFAWETHLDSDGVEREYGCFDVVIHTGKYPEANEIVGKSLSLELNKDTIEGHFILADGLPCFQFTHGELLALAVLGDDVEPAFQGAAFYEKMQKDLELAKADLVEFVKIVEKEPEKETGGNDMLKTYEFKLSHDDVYGLIWEKLNSSEFDWALASVYDDHAIAYQYSSGKYYRCYYSKENDVITLGNKVEVVITDVTVEEYQALEQRREELEKLALSYEKVEELLEEGETVDNLIAKYHSAFEALATKESEFAALTEELTEAQEKLAEVEEIQSEYARLVSFEKECIDNQKEEIFNKFAAEVPEEFLTELKDKGAEYSLEELNTKLAAKAYEISKENTKEDKGTANFSLSGSAESVPGWVALVQKRKGK